jgi:hypothetical protein
MFGFDMDLKLRVFFMDVKLPILKRFFGDHSNNYDLTLMVINHHVIPPHIDSGTLTVINIYIQKGDAITIFYEKMGIPTEYKLLNQTDGGMYNPNELQKIFSFKAKPFEAWILDVSKIHSVTMHKPDIQIAYCIMSTSSFNIVVSDYEQSLLIFESPNKKTLTTIEAPNKHSLTTNEHLNEKLLFYFIGIVIIIIVLWVMYQNK